MFLSFVTTPSSSDQLPESNSTFRLQPLCQHRVNIC
jgi:hypothetical protein